MADGRHFKNGKMAIYP